MYTLFTVIQGSKFMRVHMVLWLLFCINIYLESISVLHQNCSKNIPLSNSTGNNTMPTRELTQNNTLSQKFTFFTTFLPKSHI